MLKKSAKTNLALNNLHKGFVWACVGLTAYGFYLYGIRVYRYFTVIKPYKDEQERKAKQELLSEGSNFDPERIQ
jgi:hypothetical protein